MATIIRQGARKPIVANGVVCAGGLVTHWGPSDMPGFVRGTTIGVAIAIHDPATRKDHRLEVNPSEALQIIEQLAVQLMQMGVGRGNP